MHPDGEVAVARAAAAAGTAIGLSSFASKPIEEVVAANPPTFFQIYWLGDRERIAAICSSARAAAGAKGIIVTLDWTFAHRRDWGSPTIPERLDLQGDGEAGAARRSCGRAGCAAYLRSGGLPDLTTPNLGAARRRRRRPSSAPTASG